MNRWEYYREMDRRRTFRRWAGMFNVIGAAVAVVCILVALGLLMSLTGWVKQDLSQSLMSRLTRWYRSRCTRWATRLYN